MLVLTILSEALVFVGLLFQFLLVVEWNERSSKVPQCSLKNYNETNRILPFSVTGFNTFLTLENREGLFRGFMVTSQSRSLLRKGFLIFILNYSMAKGASKLPNRTRSLSSMQVCSLTSVLPSSI